MNRMEVNVLKRIRFLLLALVLSISSLPLFSMQAAASVASPILLSPSTSYTYITEDTTPTLIFRAAAGQRIEILEGTQIIGTGLGQGEHLVDIEITQALTPGLHQLSYRGVDIQSSDSSDLNYFSLLVSSSPLDISTIAPITSSLSANSLSHLLNHIKPIHSGEPQVNYYDSWYRIIANEDELTSTLTVTVFDEYGYPLTNLSNDNFTLDINGNAYTSSLSTAVQIAEGVYQFQFAPASPVGGVAILYLNGYSLGSQNIGPPTILTIPPTNYNVVVDQSFTLPETVQALMTEGDPTTVNVDWGTQTVNTSVSGTFEFTGTVANYAGTAKLYLTVTEASDYRIVLSWGANPSDLDSHLFGTIPAGDFHVYYSNKTYTVGEATYARMEQDITSGYGPETTTIYVTDDVGAFRFGVNKYAGLETLATSDAIVKLYRGNNLIQTFNVPTTGAAETYWNVFQIVGGQLIVDGPDVALNRLEADMDVNFHSAINRAIGVIHMLPDQPTTAEVNAALTIVNGIIATYLPDQGIDIDQYIVNYSELTSYMLQ